MDIGSAGRPQRSAGELLNLFQVQEHELGLIRDIGVSVMPVIPEMLDGFYRWMAKHPDMMAYFRDEKALDHVKSMQKKYWEVFFEAEVNDDYLAERRRIGTIHAQVDLPVLFYLAGVNTLYPLFGNKVRLLRNRSTVQMESARSSSSYTWTLR